MITIKHNFDSDKFKWLWSKYVVDGNDEKHCIFATSTFVVN